MNPLIIPFEQILSYGSRTNIERFEVAGAKVNYQNNTVEIAHNQLEPLSGTIFMGGIIRYVERSRAQSLPTPQQHHRILWISIKNP